MKAVRQRMVPWPWGVIWHTFCDNSGEPVVFHTSWFPHLYEHIIMLPEDGKEWI
jgi:L-rhamnose isomerase